MKTDTRKLKSKVNMLDQRAIHIIIIILHRKNYEKIYKSQKIKSPDNNSEWGPGMGRRKIR